MTPKEWMLDIAEAAEALGYGIVILQADSVLLARLDDQNVRVEILSRTLSGRLLRDVLLAPADRR